MSTYRAYIHLSCAESSTAAPEVSQPAMAQMSQSAIAQSSQSAPWRSRLNVAQRARGINLEVHRSSPMECPSPWSPLGADEPSPQSVPRGRAARPARLQKTMKPTVNWLSQPSSKRTRTTSPTCLAPDRNNRSMAVAYISCIAHGLECSTNRVCHEVLEAATKAIETGAEIINIAFHFQMEYEILNNICIQLELVFDAKWTSSVERPAYSYCHTGPVMSFFSTSLGKLISEATLDPEGGFPSTMLTFDTPSGVLCVITTSLPRIPSRTRARLLNFYVNAAVKANADCMLIGGLLDDLNQPTTLSLQTQVANLSVDCELVTNSDLYVLASSANCTLERSVSEPNNLTSSLVLKTFVPEPQC